VIASVVENCLNGESQADLRASDFRMPIAFQGQRWSPMLAHGLQPNLVLPHDRWHLQLNMHAKDDRSSPIIIDSVSKCQQVHTAHG
jgi:hypothetical protein